MSYNKRINWKDRIVERQRTFSETINSDGTKTLTPAPQQIVQKGTPMSAKNFNSMEEAIQHIANTVDLIVTIYSAELRDAQKRIAALEKVINGGENG